LPGLLEKRRSIHRQIETSRREYEHVESQLAHLQALANIGTVSCMIAHEMNNILTPLANYAQLALNNPADLVLTKKALQKTTLNANRAAKVLESMLSMARGQSQEFVDSRVSTLVEDVFTCICRDFNKDRIKVDLKIPSELTIRVIPIQIQQVFMNLILNARDSVLGTGGILTIKAYDSEGSACIEFSDTGQGIEPANIERIFEPFFTTKVREGNSSGAGLGLALCRQVVEAHGGRIAVRSCPGVGTTFTILLPRQ
jgi:signal transduction histidine kinase